MKSILFVEKYDGSPMVVEINDDLRGNIKPRKLQLESTNTIDALQEVRDYLLTEEAAEWNKQTLLGGFANPAPEPAFLRRVKND